MISRLIYIFTIRYIIIWESDATSVSIGVLLSTLLSTYY